MSFLVNNNYSKTDKEILIEEYIALKQTVKAYNKDTPYYVYSLCYPNGLPFYIGKGKNTRAFDHLKDFIKNKLNKAKSIAFKELGSEPPIMFIIQGNLSETDAYALEETYVKGYGRISDNGILYNIMPGGIFLGDLAIAAAGGKIGGKTTKENKLGIFADNYDRGAQTKKNFESGLMDHIDFVSIGKIAGAASVARKRGIHDPNNAHKRKEWSKIGSDASKLSGLSGVCSKEWREANNYKPLKVKQKLDKMKNSFFWNNGVINTRSKVWPGEGWVRGTIVSEKKRLSNLINVAKAIEKNRKSK